MTISISLLADIPAQTVARLQDFGVTTTEELLARAGDVADRADLAGKVGTSAQQVLAWANQADLMRIPNVAEGYTDLLEAAGVETLRELASSSPEPLAARISEVNAELGLTERVPTPGEVAAWIEAAGHLGPRVR